MYFMNRSPYALGIHATPTVSDKYLSITTTATAVSTKNTVEACSWLFMMLLAYAEYCALRHRLAAAKDMVLFTARPMKKSEYTKRRNCVMACTLHLTPLTHSHCR